MINIKSTFLWYNFNDFKKELIQMNNNKNQSVAKNVINWLVCIYAVHHLNPYKTVFSKK